MKLLGSFRSLSNSGRRGKPLTAVSLLQNYKEEKYEMENKCKKGRYMKLNPKSDGYKKGIRYIDFGKNESSKIRFLKKKPRCLK